ncbi:hypothetical protein [Marinicrinis sediminis]|uniref:Uncharacterized protein n=1 Tax=Marinicrinis sediminis TaxID=1652465 RepID=A0ABW5RBM8_9BACL
MTTTSVLNVDRNQLLQTWQSTLPDMLKEGDSCQIELDAVHPDRLHITIDMAGRTQYSFDFHCTYLDEREVKVDLVDVQQGHDAIDERSEHIQHFVKEYIRHIHECAQGVQHLTHA